MVCPVLSGPCNCGTGQSGARGNGPMSRSLLCFEGCRWGRVGETNDCDSLRGLGKPTELLPHGTVHI